MRISIFLKFEVVQEVMRAVDQKHNYNLEWPNHEATRKRGLTRKNKSRHVRST